MSNIELLGITKTFGENTVLQGIDLTVADAELMVIVGPSGSGKTTILRLIAGLEDLTGGDIRIDGKSVVNVSASERGLAMVFQSYALYPHMSVRRNIGFALTMAGMPREIIYDKVAEAAQKLNLTRFLDRKPRHLSGGERQRVAIARAIVREPKAFLLDEPLSNLDAARRVQTRFELRRLQQELRTTAVYVTHDQIEAMTIADRIAVLNDGAIIQVGAPLDLYNRPRSVFVACFIGSPRMNLVRGTSAQRLGAEVIGVRPEHCDVSRDAGSWCGRVLIAERLGSDTYLHLDVGPSVGLPVSDTFVDPDGNPINRITARVCGDATYQIGEQIYVSPHPRRIHRFDLAHQAI